MGAPSARRWASSGLLKVRITEIRGLWRERGLVLRSGTVQSSCPGRRSKPRQGYLDSHLSAH